MRLAVVHLSDIHFRDKNNPVTERLDRIAAAILSAEPAATLYLFVVSGDIAQSGARQEYEVALHFFTELKQRILRSRDNIRIEFVSVPGNHDCSLPKEEMRVRDAVISGLLPSIQEPRLDPGLLQNVLKPQENYNWFRKQLELANGDWNGVCGSLKIDHAGSRIQINLYNTALLSRRPELQGQLHLPLKIFGSAVKLDPDTALSISVLHHSYVWLESNNQIALRSQIERTSDIALLGHQHYPHSFYKVNSTGEKVLYLEGAALQDEEFPQHSAFQVLVFDLTTHEEMSIRFRWENDLYKRDEVVEWRPITINRSIRGGFTLTESFEAFLNDLGAPCAHKIRGILRLRDIYVYPEFRIRKIRGKATYLDVRGEEIIKHVTTASRILFQGPAYSGKTCLAKMLFGNLLDSHAFVPIFIDGKGLSVSNEKRIIDLFWKHTEVQYGVASVEPYRLLDKEKRVLILDAWHDTELNAEGRRAFLSVAGQYFGKIILFTDEIYQTTGTSR
jgi:hypothetical protein